MRGTLVPPEQSVIAGGIIPAYAGNTAFWAGVKGKYRDHPRVCGEHIFNAPARIELPGSSPRMRGTHIETCVFT